MIEVLRVKLSVNLGNGATESAMLAKTSPPNTFNYRNTRIHKEEKMMDITKEFKTTITEELPAGYTLVITVDHNDDEQPYDFTFGVNEFGWLSSEDLNLLKKVINKAISVKKAGI